MVSRAERTPFSAWWWTVDRLMLAALGAIMLGGIILSLAASPPVAARIGLDPFYFVNRHILYLIPTMIVLLATSFLSSRQIRRIALIVFIVSFVMVIATLFVGAEVKGARRWIVLAGINIQPSEFLKPAFVVLVAWLFAESARKTDVPATTFSLMLLLGSVGVLVLQPDFGQTMLIALVWGALFFMAGHAVHLGDRPRRHRPARAGGSLCDHSPRGAPHQALPRSGLRGYLPGRHRRRIASSAAAGSARGRGRAPSSASFPTAHADFVFAVAAEEFGIVLCLVLVALFAFIVLRALSNAMRNEDPFARFATAGLAILFGAQSAINMSVNLALIPAKGMTLPFISYGGSSMISLAFGMGMLLAFTREQPRATLMATPGAALAGSPA